MSSCLKPRWFIVLAIYITVAALPIKAQVNGVFREVYANIAGVNVADLTNAASFPNNPASTNFITDFFETPTDIDDNYGQRCRALLLPPLTGSYTFWIASDDASTLYLSTDENPANKMAIAYVGAWTSAREYFKEANQQSAPVSLAAGRRYYLEALHKEGTGGDNLAVAWQRPGDPPVVTGGLPIPASNLLVYAGAPTIPPTITAQPVNTNVVEGSSAIFGVRVSNADPLHYQWQRNSANIAGANGSTYTLAPVALSDSGAGFRCILTNSLGLATSAVATLTVTADTTPPALGLVQNIGSNSVQVIFSEPVEPASATNKLNYVITNGVTVTAAAFGSDSRTVRLSTTPLTFGSSYVLTVNQVRDRAATPNTIAPDSQRTFVVSQFTPQDVGSPTPVGGSTPSGNGVDVSGGGADIGGASDQFQFAYQQLTGNFDVAVRMQSLNLADTWTKAGLMARETLDASSRFAGVISTPSVGGTFFEYRDTIGAAANQAGSFPANYPNNWLRVQRSGNTFTGFASFDGQNWTQLGALTVALSQQIYVGFAVSSHNPGQTATAQFRDFQSVSGGIVGSLSLPNETLGPSSRKTGLVISEIMYKPAPRLDGRNLEYIEIYNSNPFFEDISGYRISGDLDYTFPANTVMQGGAFLVVAAAPADIEAIYGIANVAGPYTNSLKKSGLVRLRNDADAIFLEVSYDSVPPWPVGADGTGHSIVLARPSYGEGDGRAWALSDVVGGSPGLGEAYRPSPLRNVMINEFLAHSDAPLVDFVELYNHSAAPVDISGCILSDDPVTNTFIIPTNTIVPARGFISFDQDQMGFSLNAGGGAIYFKKPDASRVLDAVFYEDQANGVSSGRYPDGANDFYPLLSRTPGAANGGILVRDVVINEIMYSPISGNSDDGYVELYNKGTNALNLTGWRFSAGISFSFPSNTTLLSNSYLVIAKNITNLFAHYPNLNSNNTVGNFGGSLSHHGDRLALAMPDLVIKTNSFGAWVTNTVHPVADEVTYGTGGRWGQWASGGGSSLELIDPRANHRLAYNWADSDETGKAAWTNIETTGVMDNGASVPSVAGCPANFVQVGLLGAGECLVDNIEFLAGTSGPNNVANPDFESGLGNWTPEGDHLRSSLEASGYLSSQSLHLRATDQIWTGANSVVGVLNSSVPSGQTATLRLKARWLRGFPEVLLRVAGNWLETAGRMAIPANLGTPGLPNSSARANAGPAIYEVTHSPTLPAASQNVVVTARLHDPNGVQSATLNYRIDPAGTYTTVTMVDNGAGGDAIAGDGIYSATIPGQAARTVVAFYIQARDTLSTVTKFPSDRSDNAPARECVICFGDGMPAGAFGSYHLWLTQTNLHRWTSLPDLSNEPMDATWVYGPRVIYNMASHYSGSPYHQQFDSPVGSPCHYNCAMPEDDQFLGATSFNKIHAPGNGPYDDDTIQREQTFYWITRQLGLPWNYRRYVNLYVNGVRRVNGGGSGLMEDTQVPNGDVIAEHFSNDANGDFYKMQPWFEFDCNGQNFNNNSWCTLDLYNTAGGVKKLARYRWNWMIRKVEDSASRYTNVFNLVDAANLPANTPQFIQNMEAQADVEQWMRVFACSHSVGDWDHVGTQNAQNMYGYKPTQSGWQLLPWDCNIVLGNGSWSPGQNLLTTSPGQGMANVFSTTVYQRALWRAYKEIASVAMDPNRINPMMEAKYASFLANGINVASPKSSVESWIASARSSLLSQLASANANAPFTINSPGTFSTNVNLITLTGTAPVDVETITVNGVAFPLTWTDLATWNLRLALTGGANLLAIQGFDHKGNLVAGSSTTLTINYTGLAETAPGRVLINEIMYNPLVVGGEFVEFYNASTVNAFDLSNCRLEGADFNFPGGSIISPGGFLVVVKDPVVFAKTYGTTIPIAGVYNGNLDPGGESLKLVKPGATSAQDLLIDEVSYGTTLPWPAAANGFGPSLQLIDPTQDNRRVANWAAVTTVLSNPPQTLIVMANAWKYNQIDNLDGVNWTDPAYNDSVLNWSNASPAVLYASSTPQSITGGPLNTLLALTNNNSGGQDTPTFYFRTHFNYSGGLMGIALSVQTVIDDGAVLYLNGRELFRLGMPAGPITYSTINGVRTISQASLEGPFVLPANYLAAGDNVMAVEVHQHALNSSDIVFGLSLDTAPNSQSAQFTPGAPNSNLSSLPPLPPLWLNEIEPNNVTAIADHLGHYHPWVELYNSGAGAINLGGYYLANNYTNLTQWAFPSNITIGAGQFMVVYLDGNPGESLGSELHAGFTIPPVSGSLALIQTNASQATVVDYLNYSLINADRSYGAFPDGTPIHRQKFYYATPGAPNTNGYPAVPIYINEWMASNTRALADPADGNFDDWFELYNAGSAPIDLTGYTLTDTPANIGQFIIPAGYSVPANGYLLVWADKETTQNTANWPDLHVNFQLSKNGDSIGLYAPNGTNVDLVAFGAQYSDISQGRWPDGDSAIYFMTNPTPRSANVFQVGSNSPPVLSPIGSLTGNELSPLTFTALASDPDAGQTLAFSLDPGAPAGATINSASGIFNWTPTEAQGPGVYPITVRVIDNGAPSLSDAQSFAITVNEVNRPPVLNPLGDITIPELTTLSFVATATDPDLPANTLTYSLDAGAPGGAGIDPATGAFSWTPTEAQGPSTNLIIIRVTDNGVPPLSGSDSFTVIVMEVNTAPVLSAVTNQTVNAGSLLTFTARAADTDIPTNLLVFSLAAGAPVGAVITPDGVFSWTPPPGQPASTNTITVRVTDNGAPPLSDAKTFDAVVVAAPRILTITQSTGGVITLTWQTFPGKTYRVQYNNSLAPDGWTTLGSESVANDPTTTINDDPAGHTQRFYRVVQVN